MRKNIIWEHSLDRFYNATEDIVITMSLDSNIFLYFPGSLVKENDTISFAQEAGYDNKCTKVGTMDIGKTIMVPSEYGKRTVLFKSYDEILVDGDSYFKSNEKFDSYCQCTQLK